MSRPRSTLTIWRGADRMLCRFRLKKKEWPCCNVLPHLGYQTLNIDLTFYPHVFHDDKY